MWLLSPRGEGALTEEPQVAWSPRLDDDISLGIFTAKLPIATADHKFPRLFSDMSPAAYDSTNQRSKLSL